MSLYREVIYPKDDKNLYPYKLCRYLISRFVPKVGPSITLLEIGCSSGVFLKQFYNIGNFDCYGVDIRDEKVPNIIFKQCNIEKEDIPFNKDFFDIIYTKSVIEHVHNTDRFLSEAKRVLKPNGIFICMTPDWKSQMKHFWDDYTHVKPFTKKGLKDAILIHGYSSVKCEYFLQLPLVWKYPWLKYICRIIAKWVPGRFVFKTEEQRNTKDRKWIRFSKDRMLLATGSKK